jgi:hypothetical protein
MGCSLQKSQKRLIFSAKYLTGGIMSQLKISDLSFCEIESPEAEAAEGGTGVEFSAFPFGFSSFFSSFDSVEKYKEYFSTNPLPSGYSYQTWSGNPSSGRYAYAAVGRDGLGGIYSLSSSKSAM